MTLQIADRVKETTITTSTGPLALTGAMTGYRAFSSVCAVADTCNYALQAVDANGVPTGDWEVGQGTYSAANTLTRTTILSSSNAGAAVNLAAGTKQVWIDYPAAAIDIGPLGGFRNKIIGGDFGTNPWQRGINFTGVTAGTTADRFQTGIAGTAVLTIGKDSSNLPTVAQAGRLVTACLSGVVTTADASVAAGDAVFIQHVVEGYNFQPLAQRPMVLSFLHAHSKPGFYCVAFGGGGRTFVAEYTQSVANAWEYAKIVVSPSPAAGSWNYDSGTGLAVAFTMMVGTTFQTTPGTWQTGQFFGTANQVNLADAVNNTFRFALIQLEPGIIATPFEDVPVGTVLQLCQRYFCKTFAQGTVPAQNAGITNALTSIAIGGGVAPGVAWGYMGEMRVNPTIVTYSPGNASANWSNSGGTNFPIVSVANIGTRAAYITANNAPATENYFIHATASAEF